jgi:hypothetical protein
MAGYQVAVRGVWKLQSETFMNCNLRVVMYSEQLCVGCCHKDTQSELQGVR